MNPPLAVCSFTKYGKAFPVRMGIKTEVEAVSCQSWMNVGAGQFDDWRIVDAKALLDLQNEGRVTLSVFTPEAQAEKLKFILTMGKEGTP